MRRPAVLLLLLACLAATSFGDKYYEKTRFDRSIHTRGHIIVDKKPRIYSDGSTRYTAYKDAAHSVCYLEKMRKGINEVDDINLWREVIQANQKILYAEDQALTKIEAWRLAGGRIVDFCKGMTLILLQDTEPDHKHDDDPFFNVLPEDENDIVQKRVNDVVLTPLKVRAKRRAIIEERERVNQEEYLSQERRKREAEPYRGRFRGQTQSQYLSVGEGQKEGKAEAEATQQSSRAIVNDQID